MADMFRFHQKHDNLPEEVAEYVPPFFNQFRYSKLESCLVQDFHTWSSSIRDMLMPDSDFKYCVTIRQQAKRVYDAQCNENRVIFMLVAMVPNRLALQLRRHRRFSDKLDTPATSEPPDGFKSQSQDLKTLVTLGYYERKTILTSACPESPGLFVYAVNLDDDDCLLDQLYGPVTTTIPYEQHIRDYYKHKEFVSAYDVMAMYTSSIQCCAEALYFSAGKALPVSLMAHSALTTSSTPLSVAINLPEDTVPLQIFLSNLGFPEDDTQGTMFDIDSFINQDYGKDDVSDEVMALEVADDGAGFDADVGVDGSSPFAKRQCVVSLSEEDRLIERNFQEKHWCESFDPWLFYPNGLQLSTLQPLLKSAFDEASFAFHQYREQLSSIHTQRLSGCDAEIFKRQFHDVQQQVASTWKTALALARSMLSAVDAPRYSTHMDFCRASNESEIILTCLLAYMRNQCGMNPYDPDAASEYDVFLCKHNQIERAFNAQYQRHRGDTACAGALVPPLSILPIACVQDKLVKRNDCKVTTVEELTHEWPESATFLEQRAVLLSLRGVCTTFCTHELLRTAMPHVELYVPYKRFYINTVRLQRVIASNSQSAANTDVVKSLGRCLQTVQRQSQERVTLATRCNKALQPETVIQTFLKKPHDTSINLQLSIRGGVLHQMQPYAELVAHLRLKYEEACCARQMEPIYLYNEFLYLVVQLEMEMFSTDAAGASQLQFVEPTQQFFKKQNQHMAQNSHVLLSELFTNTMRSNAKLRGPTTAPDEKHLPNPLKNGGKAKICDKGGSARMWPLNFEFSADDINRQTTFLKKQTEQVENAPPAPTGRLRLVTKVMAYTVSCTSSDEVEFEFASPEAGAGHRLDAGLLSLDQVHLCVQLAKNRALCIKQEPFEMATKTRINKFDQVCARLEMKVQG